MSPRSLSYTSVAFEERIEQPSPTESEKGLDVLYDSELSRQIPEHGDASQLSCRTVAPVQPVKHSSRLGVCAPDKDNLGTAAGTNSGRTSTRTNVPISTRWMVHCPTMSEEAARWT